MSAGIGYIVDRFARWVQPSIKNQRAHLKNVLGAISDQLVTAGRLAAIAMQGSGLPSGGTRGWMMPGWRWLRRNSRHTVMADEAAP